MRKMELKLKEISKTYQTRHKTIEVLRNLNLDIAKGELVCVLGQSGCGKTTLLQIAAGLEQPSTGYVYARDQLISGPDRRLGMVFQGLSLFPWLDVTENIAFGLKAQGVRDWQRRVKGILQLVGLNGFEKVMPRQLSGGMAQRVALARTLVNKPEVLLLDEPFSSLDIMTRITMEEELVQIWQETEITMLFVTHNIDEAIYLGNRVVILTERPGQIKRILDISLPRPRDRGHPDFFAMRRRIYETLGWRATPSIHLQN